MTLRANELRIGNIVDTINRSHRVHLPSNYPKKIGAIGLFDVDLYDINKPFAQQEPIKVKISDLAYIPLTEEWLLKFGFEKRTDFNPNPYNIVFAWMNHAVMLIPAKGLHEYLFWWEGGNTTLRYVHQLQNLYFALTGEELPLANHPL